MEKKLQIFESFTLFTFALLTIFCGFFGNQFNLFNQIPINNYLSSRTDAIVQLLIMYGGIFGVLTGVSLLLGRFHQTTLTAYSANLALETGRFVKGTMLASTKKAVSIGRTQMLLFLTTLSIATMLRGYFLAQPIRYDEAATFLNYVRGDVSNLLNYSAPNNQLLHSILVEWSTTLWSVSPTTIRLPAYISGLLVVVLVFLICRILDGDGFYALIAATLSPFLILYSTNGRGYTLAMVLTLLMVWVGLCFLKEPSRGSVTLLGFLGTLNLFTIPSMLFAVAGVYLWITSAYFLKTRSLSRTMLYFAIPCGLICAVLTLLLYSPVIIGSGGYEQIVFNRFVKSLTWTQFSTHIGSHFKRTYDVFVRDVPTLVQCLILVGVIVGLLITSLKKQYSLLLLSLSLIVGAAVILVAKRSIPYPRTWSYLIPLLIILFDVGISHTFTILKKRLSWFRSVEQWGKVAILISAFFATAWLISNDTIAKYPDTGVFPEAHLAVKYLKNEMNTTDTMRAYVPADFPIFFYKWYEEIPASLPTVDDPTNREFLIVQNTNYQVDRLTEENVVEIFSYKDLTIFEIIK